MNPDWMVYFPDSCLKNFPFLASDHCPILLDPSPNDVCSAKNWKFFECWLRDKTCKDQITNSWSKQFRGSPGFVLDKKLSDTRRELSNWNRNTFSNIQGNLKVLHQQLSDLQQPTENGSDNTLLVQDVEKNIKEWHKREEVFYRKKSREVFFNEVDQITKHFHLQANKRRAKNRIESLKRQDRSWCSRKNQLETLLTDHFKNIMTTSNPPCNDALLNLVPPYITEEDNTLLTKIRDEAKIHNTLKQMQPWKAPGPDGFSPGFFQCDWCTFKDDVIKMVQNFFCTGRLLKKIN
ncbi:uncharacterized protein LOC113324828 [Papaver somniferum]|uniref:uncharacterized protein LOC113324828 n=1 Tax=Papaver somniferum TaxID=3469 RepID=UPI000E7010ED|nr:uncharacterized protein LOC113324828 [Papaver somniferum]